MVESGAPVFAVQDLGFSYGEGPVLEQLNMEIQAGERVALLGANGSGKSTLLRLLGGLSFAERGRIDFQGDPLTEVAFKNPTRAREFRRRVGILFQDPEAQLFNPTVFDEIAFGPLQLRWPEQQVRDRVAEMLEQFRIAHLAARPPFRLSAGEKKRVALASVLAVQPEVLLLDEPTAALDPRSQSQVIELIGASFSGGTVVTAIHELAILEEIADRVFILDGGQVAGVGAPHEILADQALLERANLVHVHRHHHSHGEIHSHPHLFPGHRH